MCTVYGQKYEVVIMYNHSVPILLVLCLGTSLSDTVCSFSPSTASITCTDVPSDSLPRRKSTDVPRDNQASAELVCSHDQPVLQKNVFTHLQNLSKLEIERCPALHIRRRAFEGLRQLHTVKVCHGNNWHYKSICRCFLSFT